MTRVLKGCVKAADWGMERCGGLMGGGGAGGSGSGDGVGLNCPMSNFNQRK